MDYRLTLNGLTPPLQGSSWTIDGAYVYRGGDVTPVAGSRIAIRNGGYLYCHSLFPRAYKVMVVS